MHKYFDHCDQFIYMLISLSLVGEEQIYILHLCHNIIFNFHQFSSWCKASAGKETLEIQKRVFDIHYAIFLSPKGQKLLDYLAFSCYSSKPTLLQFRGFPSNLCPYRYCCNFYCVGCITMIILITFYPLLSCYEKIELTPRNVISSMLSDYRFCIF